MALRKLSVILLIGCALLVAPRFSFAAGLIAASSMPLR